MSEEEKKAINNLFCSITDVMFNVLYSQEKLEKDLKITLNLIQKQQRELEKKDKIINNMSNYIYNVDYRSECGNNREQVKQYFERKVEFGWNE